MCRMKGLVRFRKKTFILVFILLLSVPILFGQGYYDFRTERERIIKNAPWKIGLFRIFPRFQLRDIGYDDNVYFQRETGGAVSDFTGTFSPEVTVHVLFRSFFILSVKENPQYVYFVHENRERRWTNTFSPFFETPRRTSIGIQMEKERITYEDIILPDLPIHLGQALNRDEKRIHGELYYRILPASFFFLRGGTTEYSFLDPTSQWRDSHSYQLYAGIRLPRQRKLRGTFSLGYKKLIPKSEEKQGFSGFVADSQVEYGTGKMAFRFRTSRDCVFSYWTNNIFFIYLLGSAGLSYYVTESLRLDYQFQHGVNRYPEPFLFQGESGWEEIIRRDTHDTHTVGFAVRIVRNTGLGIRLVWWEWLSNLPGVDRNWIFIGGYITYEF